MLCSYINADVIHLEGQENDFSVSLIINSLNYCILHKKSWITV